MISAKPVINIIYSGFEKTVVHKIDDSANQHFSACEVNLAEKVKYGSEFDNTLLPVLYLMSFSTQTTAQKTLPQYSLYAHFLYQHTPLYLQINRLSI